MNLNKVFIIGRLTRDPESRITPQGQTVTTFGLATNRVWTDKDGKKQEKTEYHNIVTWGKLAQICGQYLIKGKLVLIEGRLETRSWEGQDGVKRQRTEIIAEGMQMGPRAGTPLEKGVAQEEVSSVSIDEMPKIEEESEEIEVKDIPF